MNNKISQLIDDYHKIIQLATIQINNLNKLHKNYDDLKYLYPRGSAKQAISWKMASDSAESDGCTLYYNTIL